MAQFIAGDDIGGWPPVAAVPAMERPLAAYVAPYSNAHRCPNDESPHFLTYGQPLWDYVTTSYTYNYLLAFSYDWLFGAQINQVLVPSITAVVADGNFGATRPNLPGNDLESYTSDPSAWFHPRGFEDRMSNVAFVDGHVAWIGVQILVAAADNYRRSVK